VEARRDTVLGCGTPAAQPGCRVAVRWLYQVARGQPARSRCSRRSSLGFELAQADPRVVGFNLVHARGNRVAPCDDFTLQMRIIDYLHRIYPAVKVTLHAGELAPGLVPPEGLRASHVRQSVELGHASRIGHGVDVLHEDRPHELLRDLARRGVMVEIALTSNDVILGVRGDDHPLRAYLAYGVPVALATDDEGVSRSEMTREYLKAVRSRGWTTATLKRMARTSLEHAFVQGASLWRNARTFTPVAECAPGRRRAAAWSSWRRARARACSWTWRAPSPRSSAGTGR
jgi:adenosine deaminase